MAELALTGGSLEKSEWGAGGIAKVSFKAKWGLDRAQILIYTHTYTHTQHHTGSYQTKAGELYVS